MRGGFCVCYCLSQITACGKINKSVAIVEQLKAQVEQALVHLSLASEQAQDGSIVTVEICKRIQYGDFSCGVAIGLAQGQDLFSMELARKIAASITEQQGLAAYSVNVSPPGFINFDLTREFLSSVLLDIQSRFDDTDDVPSTNWTDSGSKNCYELCCSILRCATEPSFDLINEIELAPLMSAGQWQECKLQYKKTKQSFDAGFESQPDLFMRQKSLVLMLERAISPRAVQPGLAISNAFAKFYQGSRIFTDQPEVTKARLGLVLAVKLVLEQTIRSQPEQACELR
jgi:hypothetical protein